MKRKVNLVGTSTLTVSLPSKWAQKHGLKAGDEVEVDEEDFNLIIHQPGLGEKVEKTKIKLLKGNYWYISQIIRNLYFAGYDEIEVEFEEPSLISSIQKIVNLLMGYEIVEQKSNYCLIKTLSVAKEDEFDTLVRKVFLLSLQVFDLMIDDFAKNEVSHFKEIDNLNVNIHRFGIFCRRMLTKKHLLTERSNRAMYIMLMRLTMVTNDIYYLYRYLIKKNKINFSKSLVEAAKDVRALYNLFYQTFYNKKLENMPKINDERERLIEGKFTEILEKYKGENAVAAHYLAEIVRIISTSGGVLLTILTGQ